MKLISRLLILSVLIIYVFASINIVEKRGVISEPIIFEVEVKAPCEAYLSRVINSIQISRVTSPTCLPISPVNSTQDINDYHAHVFCTNTIRGRSLFRFHEIFVVEEDETPAPGAQFIVSWLSEFPFVEKTRRYSYARRPTCSIGTDVCSSLQIVNQCYDNYVDLRKGYVSSSDRVYFIPPSVTVGTCSLNDNCCPYISTGATGICGGQEVDPCSLVNCDDSNLCTTDSCSGGNCTHTTISCDDGNACTTDTCNPLTGCVHTSISCDDGFLCTTDTCNPSTGCVHTQRNCSSTDFCQINGRCDNSTGLCVTDPRTCTGSNLCAESAFCNSTSQQCQDVPKVCPNNQCYTNGACNMTTGACDYTRTSCNDNDPCTNNRCDNTTGCYFPPVVCSDNNSCSVDYCNPLTGTCFNIFYCSNTDECFNRVCTNDCPAPPALCPSDPSTTAALAPSVITARSALNCIITPTGNQNCRRKNPEITFLENSSSPSEIEQPIQINEQKKPKKKRPSLFGFLSNIFSSKKKN